jgi:large subunit ribosomal protein L18
MALKKQLLRLRRKKRIRSRVSGTASCPRLSVYRSNRAFSAQLIDDELGVVVASAQTKSGNTKGAEEVAGLLSKKYSGPCVFDRNGYSYQGKVLAFADAARKSGILF